MDASTTPIVLTDAGAPHPASDDLDAGGLETVRVADDSDYAPSDGDDGDGDGEEEEDDDDNDDEGAAAAAAAPPPPPLPDAETLTNPNTTTTAAAAAAAPPPPPQSVLLRPPDLSTLVMPPDVAAFSAAVAERSAAAAMTPGGRGREAGGAGDVEEEEDDDGQAAGPADGDADQQQGPQQQTAQKSAAAQKTPPPPPPPPAPSLDQLQDAALRLLRPPPHRPYLAGVPRDDGTGAFDVYAVLPGQKPPVGATALFEVAAQRPGAAPPPIRRYQRQLFAQAVSMHARMEQHGRDMDVAHRAVAACGVAAARAGGGGGGGGGGAAAAAAGGNNGAPTTAGGGGGARGPAPGALRRDPAAPKRAMTSYLAFAVRQRAAIVDEVTGGGARPVPPPTEVMRLLAERWRAAPPGEREACERMAQEDRARYERERAAYTGPLTIRVGPGRGGGGGDGGGGGGGGGGGLAEGDDLVEAAMAPFRRAMMTHQQQQQQQQQEAGGDGAGLASAAAVGPNGGKLRGPRDAGAPALPRSAYLMFVTDYRRALERGVPFGEATKRAADAWRSAGGEERAPFEAAAARDQARFAEDMRRYREGTYVPGGGGGGGGVDAGGGGGGGGGGGEMQV